MCFPTYVYSLKLFPKQNQSKKSGSNILINRAWSYFDGASLGNPSIAQVGVLLFHAILFVHIYRKRNMVANSFPKDGLLLDQGIWPSRNLWMVLSLSSFKIHLIRYLYITIYFCVDFFHLLEGGESFHFYVYYEQFLAQWYFQNYDNDNVRMQF